MEPTRLTERGAAIGRLGHHLEVGASQEHAGVRAKPGVVVDDENGGSVHVPTSCRRRSRHGLRCQHRAGWDRESE